MESPGLQGTEGQNILFLATLPRRITTQSRLPEQAAQEEPAVHRSHPRRHRGVVLPGDAAVEYQSVVEVLRVACMKSIPLWYGDSQIVQGLMDTPTWLGAWSVRCVG